MSEEIRKAFDFAQETTKQVIALSTGILALTVTFITDILGSAPAGTARYIYIAWLLYVVSVVFGLATMLTLTGNLEKQQAPSIYEPNTRVFSILQLLTFVAALALTIVFGWKST